MHRGFMLSASICMCCISEQTPRIEKKPRLVTVLIMIDIERMLNLKHFFLFLHPEEVEILSLGWSVCLFVRNDNPSTFACCLRFGKIKVDFLPLLLIRLYIILISGGSDVPVNRSTTGACLDGHSQQDRMDLSKTNKVLFNVNQSSDQIRGALKYPLSKRRFGSKTGTRQQLGTPSHLDMNLGGCADVKGFSCTLWFCVVHRGCTNPQCLPWPCSWQCPLLPAPGVPLR